LYVTCRYFDTYCKWHLKCRSTIALYKRKKKKKVSFSNKTKRSLYTQRMSVHLLKNINIWSGLVTYFDKYAFKIYRERETKNQPQALVCKCIFYILSKHWLYTYANINLHISAMLLLQTSRKKELVSKMIYFCNYVSNPICLFIDPAINWPY